MSEKKILKKFINAIVYGNKKLAKEAAVEALKRNISAYDILTRGLSKAMDFVGEKFERKECFLLELLLSSEAMYAGLEVLKPYLEDERVKTAGKILLGTVHGDIHTIGKDIVKIMLEGARFEVIDLGADVPVEKFVTKVRELKPDIVGMSALITPAREEMRKTIEELRKEGLREKVRVMIGGAAVSQTFASMVGADAYGKDAKEAVDNARKLLEKK